MTKSVKPFGEGSNDALSIINEIEQKFGMARVALRKDNKARAEKYQNWAKKLQSTLKAKIKATEDLGETKKIIRDRLVRANRAKADGNLELFSDLLSLTLPIIENSRLTEEFLYGCTIEELMVTEPERITVFKADKIMKVRIEKIGGNTKRIQQVEEA